MDLSIIIVSYNVKDYLLGCLRSIYREPPVATFEVIVVDNVSADGTVEAVRGAFPQVKLLASQKNLGFARGNNLGLRESSGDLVLFLNPDTEVGPGALAGLVRLAEGHPEVAAFTCRLLNPDGTLQHSCFHFPSLAMAFYGFFPFVSMDSVANGRYPAEQFALPFQPEHILGACLMFRRQALVALGGWDERYFMYFEETDLCFRLRRAGMVALYTPEVSVIHYGGRSTVAAPEKMSVAFYRSQGCFYRQHYSSFVLVALKVIVCFGLLFWTARSAKGFLRRRITWGQFRARLASYAQILIA
jgi:hypothetical protein